MKKENANTIFLELEWSVMMLPWSASVSVDNVSRVIQISILNRQVFLSVKEVLDEVALPAPTTRDRVADSIGVAIRDDNGNIVAVIYFDYYKAGKRRGNKSE